MSTDLKTLKDIEHYDEDCDYDSEGGKSTWITESLDGDYVKVDDLRSEAIKWIKELNQAKNNYCKGHYYFMLEESVDASDITSVIKFIRHFFNITDEDLK